MKLEPHALLRVDFFRHLLEATNMQTEKHDKGSQPERLSYSIQEFAELNGLCETTVHLEIKAGRLKTIRAGRRRLIPMYAAEEWLGNVR